MELPAAPRLFLVDGYALIYRAFFALISHPLKTGRGENTSAAWGIANFLQRLLTLHHPEYLGWVHDSGLSFRHERYPAYKATREKLTEELQADFDTGMARVCTLLEAYHIPILSLEGYEADDVIGTLVLDATERKINTVVVSGDKDFQQLVRPGVWLLNPGRGGPASVEEQWVGVENGSERLGVAPQYVTDYLALVGDSSDNVPGVKGIGEKTARELIGQYGHLDDILARAEEIQKKRPREALLEHSENARLSKELVTIREDLPMVLDLEALRVKEPDAEALKRLYLELEFHSLAKEAASTSFEAPKVKEDVSYVVVDTVDELKKFAAKARNAKIMSIDTETDIDRDSPTKIDPLRSKLVSVAIALASGEAYYFPFNHTTAVQTQGELLEPKRASQDAAADVDPRCVIAEDILPPVHEVGNATTPAVRNLPSITSPDLQPLRDLLEDASIKKIGQNAKYDILVLRRAV